MDRTTIDLWVGLFVALGFAALLGLAMKVGNLTANKIGATYSVTAAFGNIGSLKLNAPVKSAGVVVGRVDKIEFQSANYEAIVTINIDKRYDFPADTFANIYTAGLLGEQYVGLEAGGDEVVLKNGGKIAKTQDAIVLEKMISQFLFSKASETDTKTTAPSAKDAATGVELKAGKSTELGDAPF
ncbi:MAG: outer membrane lipid asymmetry maintenance protein MlaD [Methylotenera sp.]|nr:outer membrane lipid asymmetry maintenance protein MlaD [Methylotenera sp.]MSP99580.1 outer membrane lipid asymmetry maintenance protein MlaD [Methylotenera sp.]